MFYFLCEGSEGKSDYTFIKAIIEEYHTTEEYELHSLDGNRNIYILNLYPFLKGLIQGITLFYSLIIYLRKEG